GAWALRLWGRDGEGAPDARAVTAALPRAEEAPSPGSSGLVAEGPPRRRGSGRWLALGALGLALVACAAAIVGRSLWGGSRDARHRVAARPPLAPDAAGPTAPAPPAGPVEVNVAYGTEKRLWLE